MASSVHTFISKPALIPYSLPEVPVVVGVVAGLSLFIFTTESTEDTEVFIDYCAEGTVINNMFFSVSSVLSVVILFLIVSNSLFHHLML